MAPPTAYLPLQHQLFGEQHGLFAERFCHLHPSGRIPRTAWTFDTCGQQRHKSAVSAAANHDSDGGGEVRKSSRFFQLLEIKRIIHAHLRVATEVKRSGPKLFAGPFHKSYGGRALRIIGIAARVRSVIAEKRTTAVLCVGLWQEELSFGLFWNRKTRGEAVLWG